MTEPQKTVILTCPTLHDELELLVKQANCNYDVHELTDANHNLPDKLRNTLQDTIDSLQNYDRIVLTFGLCGKATVGLISPHAELIMPMVDDCISLLMGSPGNRLRSLNGSFGIFITAGWMRFSEGMFWEVQQMLQKYPPKRAERIIKKMYENLTYLTVIDTGAYDPEEILPEAQEMADRLNLQLRVLPADLSLFRRLLTYSPDDAASHPDPADHYIKYFAPGTRLEELEMRVDFK